MTNTYAPLIFVIGWTMFAGAIMAIRHFFGPTIPNAITAITLVVAFVRLVVVAARREAPMTPADTLTPAELDRMEKTAIRLGDPQSVLLISRIRTLESERDALRAAVKEAEGALNIARNSLGKAGGTALGVAISGSDHPDPDGVLTDVFEDCNSTAETVSIAFTKLRALPPADGGA